MNRARPFCLIGVFALLCACGAPSAAQPSTSAAPTQPAARAVPSTAPSAEPSAEASAVSAAPIRLTDSLGRNVTLSSTPRRIVSLAPSVTETLFAVGAGPLVVGDTSFCNFPPEADALPEIGGFSATSISVEAIVGLQPDLVIAGTASQKPVVESLEQLGIPVLVQVPESFDAVYAAIAQLGAITDRAPQAEQLVADMRARVDAVAARVAAVPADRRPTVFWEVFDDPLTTSGPQTFIDQLIELAGATNLFADAQERYPQISAETVVERDPDVIIGPSSQAEKLTPALLNRRPGWGSIQAVRDGRVYTLDGDSVSRPGPRLVEALEALVDVVYAGQPGASAAGMAPGVRNPAAVEQVAQALFGEAFN